MSIDIVFRHPPSMFCSISANEDYSVRCFQNVYCVLCIVILYSEFFKEFSYTFICALTFIATQFVVFHSCLNTNVVNQVRYFPYGSVSIIHRFAIDYAIP